MPAPTPTAAPVTSAASTSKMVSASASGACPRTNGPCSCPIITPAMSIGRRSRPIARASPATPGRGRTKAVVWSEKVPPCFRASPPAVTVAADCAPIIGHTTTPRYHCAGKHIVNGRGVYCLNIGGVQIDHAIVQTILAAVTPASVAAAVQAAERLEADDDAALGQRRRDVERRRYAAQQAERRYRAVDAENRLVARGLEAEWEQTLVSLHQAEAELARRERQRRQSSLSIAPPSRPSPVISIALGQSRHDRARSRCSGP